MPRALITGIAGQDGSYLAEFLLERGYEVFGIVRPETWRKPNNASHLAGRIHVFPCDVNEGTDVSAALQAASPDEIYNLASQSRPGESWVRAPETLMTNGLAAIRLFDAARHRVPAARIYQASSSEMFGHVRQIPQDEDTPFDPANPYAAAKLFAHSMAKIHREGYGSPISIGILFNHESERRPLHYVSQKIAHGAACAALGVRDSPELNELGRPIVAEGKLALGNLDIERDWGHAKDFVRAMWLILQHDRPDDFVIGTGKVHTLRQLCEFAYRRVGLSWADHVINDPRLVRPAETGITVADASKARRLLGWQPTIAFAEMVAKMVDAQLARLKLLK